MTQHQEKLSGNKTQVTAANTNESSAPVQLKDNRKMSVVQRKLQEKTTAPDSTFTSVQKKSNNTGLPDNLKSGIENLSGHSMDDVKVHYNSSQPAQLNAHAYAQGTNIHIASGQEKHLPHEAWHVVQQKQGRVKPTLQMKGKVNVNDDKGLENEADVMGAKAAQLHSMKDNRLVTQKANGTNPVVQRMYWWAPYAALGIVGMIGLYAWWNSGKKQPPPNLTDVTFPGKYAKEDLEDTFDKLPKEELEMLGITISGTRVTSPHHPDLLQAIGANVKTTLRRESSDELMSSEGKKYDREEANRLVKSAGVEKGEGIHKTKSQSSVVGESHNSTVDKGNLVRKLAESDSTGKRTLYIEIIKEMQPIIDFWQKKLQKNPRTPMPETLKRYLFLLDSMIDKYDVSGDKEKIFVEPDPLGTYTNIVLAAAKVGIRIVGMDSLHAKNMTARGTDPDNYKRAAAMNQSAFEVIKEDQIKNPSEYLVYTGQAHVNRQEYDNHAPLMGLSERLGIPGNKKKTD
jgi:phage-related protein